MSKIEQEARPAVAGDTEEVDVFDVLILLAKNKKYLIRVPLVAGLVALALSFVLPPVYRADTAILPPQQSQGGGAAALLAQLGGAGGLVAGAAGIKNPDDLYMGMLQSRRVADTIIKKFNLMQVYDTDSMERARKILDAKTSVSSGKDNIITVVVEHTEKDKVAAIANAYVEELDRLTKTLAVTEAAHRRVFYEHELEQVKNNLAAAELQLKQSLDKQGVISVDVQSRALVETMGRLRAQISAKEIQLNAMKAFLTPNNVDYQQVERELESARAELSKLENGSGDGKDGAPTERGLQSIKVLRDIKYNQTLYELLAKQYEIARLDEANDAALIQVLDRAVEPEKKVWPKPLLLAVSTAAIALFLTLAFVFASDAKARLLRREAAQQKWHELRSLVRTRQ